uniref:Uncharacterized protein n=1 Tax=Hippocampus comes TaxID=109280 RepID=A0A3Q2ZNK6_HIPCM
NFFFPNTLFVLTCSCRRGQHGSLTCFSLKERLPLVRTFWLCLIIMKFFVRFNLVFFFTKNKRVFQTIAVARRVSLSAFGFLWSLSISLRVSSSPLENQMKPLTNVHFDKKCNFVFIIVFTLKFKLYS